MSELGINFESLNLTHGSGPVAKLSFVVRQGWGIGTDTLSVAMDQEMVARPPQYAPRFKQGISFGRSGPAYKIDFSPASYSVTESLKEVTIPIQRSVGRQNTFSIEVPFTWKNTYLIPRQVTIGIKVHYLGTLRLKKQIVGTNISAQNHDIARHLVSFLQRTQKTDFLFPTEDVSVDVEYEQLSPVVSKVQSFSDTIVSGTTWPSELAFWNSYNGHEYLARQIAANDGNKPNTPRRIVVCPYSLGYSETSAMTFLEELEVQARCGVDIRVVVLEQVATDLGGNVDGLLSFGKTLGVLYKNLAPTQSGASAAAQLLLSTQDISDIRERYDHLRALGKDWELYKSLLKVKFDYPTISRVRNKEIFIKLRANQLRIHCQT